MEKIKTKKKTLLKAKIFILFTIFLLIALFCIIIIQTVEINRLADEISRSEESSSEASYD